MSSTTIQWTMKLSDAGLISDTLLKAAEDAIRQADYIESDAYADRQRDEFVRREQAKPEGEPRKRRGSWPGLSDADVARVAELRLRAARLQELAAS